MNKSEMKKEAQNAIDEITPLFEVGAEILEENEELLDKVVAVYGKTIVRVFSKVLDQVDTDTLNKSAAKRAIYLGCLWSHLVEDAGFTESEATQIVAGQNK